MKAPQRWIIVVDGASIEAKEAFTEYLIGEEYNWWHWMSNAWLTVSMKAGTEGVAGTESLRDAAKKHMPDAFILVIRIRDCDVSGRVPRDGADWIANNWSVVHEIAHGEVLREGVAMKQLRDYEHTPDAESDDHLLDADDRHDGRDMAAG